MKIKLEIELDVCDSLDGKSDEQISEILFEGYINYVAEQHLGDAVEYCSLGRVGSETPYFGYTQLFNYHKRWGKMCSEAKWTFVKSEV